MSDHTETEHVPLARPTAPNLKYWAHIQIALRVVDSHIVEGENRRFKHGKLMEKLEDTSDVIKSVRAAAATLGVSLIHAETTSTNYAGEFDSITRAQPHALFVTRNGLWYANAKILAEFGLKTRLPGTFPFRENVEAGGLMTYVADLPDLYRRAAGYVDKILKGAKPGELPIEQPTKFELVINLKTAKTLGLTIPQSIVLRTDDVIE